MDAFIALGLVLPVGRALSARHSGRMAARGAAMERVSAWLFSVGSPATDRPPSTTLDTGQASRLVSSDCRGGTRP